MYIIRFQRRDNDMARFAKGVLCNGLVLDRFVRLTYFIDTNLNQLLWNLFRIIEIKATRLIKYLNYLL